MTQIKETIELEKENEYRFEVGFDSVLTVTVCCRLSRGPSGFGTDPCPLVLEFADTNLVT
jgi:hypothetical protein